MFLSSNYRAYCPGPDDNFKNGKDKSLEQLKEDADNLPNSIFESGKAALTCEDYPESK